MRRALRGLVLGAGLLLWAASGQPADPPDRPMLRLELGAHGAAIRRLAVDERLGLVVTASDDKTARVWDLQSGELRRTLRPPIGDGVVGRLYGAAIHPVLPLVAVAGTTSLAASGHAIYLFDLESGRLARRIDARAGDVKRLLWSPDGTQLVAAYHGAHGIRSFDLQGRLLFEDTFGGGCYGLAFSKQGLLAATAMDGRLHLYRVAGMTLQPERVIATQPLEQFSVAFAPDGRRLVVGYAVRTGPEIFDVASGASVRRLAPPGLDTGEDVRSVVWTGDGRTIVFGGRDAAGGRDTRGTPSFVLTRYDVERERFAGPVAVGRDTVLDLVALGDGAIAFASLDGTWGRLGADDRLHAAPPAFADLRGAGHLALSADARRVGWRFAFGANPGSFDFDKRVVALSVARDLAAPQTRRGLLAAATDWEDKYTPAVNGARITLEAGEISRAFALADNGADGFLGTSAGLYRIDGGGKVVWRVRTPAEVRAVNVAAGARFVVTAHADGTLHWWRVTDGAELLALFAAQDGRWVAWTPDGYFDTSPGADTLVGWYVNRGPESAADFFSVGRFRERFHRPALIDLVFRTGDVGQALLEAERLRQQGAADAVAIVPSAPAPATPLKPPAPAPAASAAAASAPQVTLQLPPSLAALGSTRLAAAGGPLEISFAVRASSPRAEVTIEARLDGRPAAVLDVVLPPLLDGSARGTLRIAAPAAGVASLILVARDRFGYSEPLAFRVEMHESAPKPAPAAPPSAAAVPVAPAAARRLPRLYVLAVGISVFRQASYNLVLASKDARDFSAAVSRQKGALYSEVVTRTLVDGAATRGAVLDGLRWLTETTQPGDVAMLFLAGHGVNTAAGTYYFVPHDGEFERLDETAVSEAAVRDALRTIRGRTLFFIDTCHAGNAMGTIANASRELSRFANSLASAENGVVVFASSTGRQNSEESDSWGNGAFTKALVDGLGGKADVTRKGQVTFKALDFFVSEEVRRLTSGRQTPVTIIPVGVPDFALARTL